MTEYPARWVEGLCARHPVSCLVLAFSLSIALFGSAAVYLAAQSVRLVSEGLAPAGLVAAGAVSGAVLPGVLTLFTYLQQYLPEGWPSKTVPFLAWATFVVWLLMLIVFLSYERSDVEPPIMGHGFGHAYAAGSFAFFFGLLVVGGVRMWPRGPLSTPAETAGGDVAHRVTVNRVAASGTEPYYVAICGCGWVGLDRSASEEAFAEARSHSPNVASGIEEPLEKP